MPDKETWTVEEVPTGRKVVYGVFDGDIIIEVCRSHHQDYAKRIAAVPDAADVMERLLEQARKWGPASVYRTSDEHKVIQDTRDMIKRLRGK